MYPACARRRRCVASPSSRTAVGWRLDEHRRDSPDRSARSVRGARVGPRGGRGRRRPRRGGRLRGDRGGRGRSRRARAGARVRRWWHERALGRLDLPRRGDAAAARVRLRRHARGHVPLPARLGAAGSGRRVAARLLRRQRRALRLARRPRRAVQGRVPAAGARHLSLGLRARPLLHRQRARAPVQRPRQARAPRSPPAAPRRGRRAGADGGAQRLGGVGGRAHPDIRALRTPRRRRAARGATGRRPRGAHRARDPLRAGEPRRDPLRRRLRDERGHAAPVRAGAAATAQPARQRRQRRRRDSHGPRPRGRPRSHGVGDGQPDHEPAAAAGQGRAGRSRGTPLRERGPVPRSARSDRALRPRRRRLHDRRRRDLPPPRARPGGDRRRRRDLRGA